jgi:hypothetical protein
VNAVAALLCDLDRTGVRLRLDGDRIAYRGLSSEQQQRSRNTGKTSSNFSNFTETPSYLCSATRQGL